MKLAAFIEREKHVALHAQPQWLRAIKYPVILAVLIGTGWWKGWMAAASLLLSLVALGTVLHFLLRWKTKGWTQSWGPYKKIELPK